MQQCTVYPPPNQNRLFLLCHRRAASAAAVAAPGRFRRHAQRRTPRTLLPHAGCGHAPLLFLAGGHTLAPPHAGGRALLLLLMPAAVFDSILKGRLSSRRYHGSLSSIKAAAPNSGGRRLYPSSLLDC
ncbi:unnamed protein product [Urochloa humidicola]